MTAKLLGPNPPLAALRSAYAPDTKAIEDVREGAGNQSFFSVLNVCKHADPIIAPAAARSEGTVNLAWL